MADLGLLGKFIITRLYAHLWRRSLQQNVPLWLHFKCILIKRWCDLRQGVFEARIVGLLFWAFFLGPPLAKSQKMADLSILGKFVITWLYGHLWRRSLQQNVPLWLHFTSILIRRWYDLRQGVFEARIVGLLFWAFSLGPPLAKSQKMADLGLLGKFVITRLYGHLWMRSLQQNVPLWLHFKCILIRRWCNLRQGVFEASIGGLLFLSIFPWSPLAKYPKMADLSLLGKFVITWLYGHLWRRSLQQNVPLWLHFKRILVRRWRDLRQGVFEARIVGLLCWVFSLGPPLAKSPKMADLSLLGKFVITRLYGHLWMRSLQQNVPLWLHFTSILIRRWYDLRQGVFEARIVGLLFWAFSLGAPLAKSQKMADLGLLGKFVITRLYGHLWMRSLQQNVPLWLHFKCILIRRWCDLRQGVFEASIGGLLFLSIFPWSPLAKYPKMADLSLLGKFVITWLYGHLWRRSLQQNVPLWLHFKRILVRRWRDLRQGVFEARIVGLLCWVFSLGPPLAKSPKMADLSLLGKFVITRLYGHLWMRSLQQNVPLWLHFTSILIRRWYDLRQGVFEARIVGLLFWAFSLGAPLAKSQKMADLGLLGKFVITRLYGHLWMRSLQQNVPLWLHFKCILIRRWCDLRQGVFEASIGGLLFLSIFPWSPLAKYPKMADLSLLGKFVITWLYGHLWRRSLQQNVPLWLHFKRILVRRWRDLRQGVFEARIVGLLFWVFSLGPPLEKSPKMADLSLLGKFVITWLYGHLWMRSLQQNVPLWLHFTSILIRRWYDLRQGVFEARIVGLLFWAFSLGPPLAKSQKMADLGLLGKFVITRLYGHLWMRSLQQNVPLWLHFKCILIRRWCDLCQGVFEASIGGLLFLSIFPWSPLAKYPKMADLSLLGKFVITWLYGHLWRRSLQQNVPLWLHFKRILVRRWRDLRQGVFEARIVGLLFWVFSVGPPLEKSPKMADLSLLGKFVITWLYGHLWRRSLQQNVSLWLHFKCILITRWCDLRQGVFEAHIFGLLLWAFSLDPPLAKSQKITHLGLFGKFVITRLHGHLWRRSLQQNVSLWLHFKCILITRWCDLRQGVFEARIFGQLLWAFSLGPPLAKSQKMADLGLLGKFVITRL